MTAELELRGITKRFPGVLACDGVDLTVQPGEIHCLVGENGAGKTTLVKLLCRFHEATEGSITVDGTDLCRMPQAEWRARIAVGFQDFMRFEFTAQRTVGIGDLPRHDDPGAAATALDRAHAGDVVDRLAQGLATPLGKSYTDGAEPSGGQWQKLALGRAMMRDRPLLLVLDEPTAALDAEAEDRLFEHYAAHARRVGGASGAISLFVTHRYSTVRAADLILVIRDGRIAERGDHATLMARGGLYAELYTLQAAAYH